MSGRRDVLLECAEGGHLDEMMEILPAFEGYNLSFVTTYSRTTEYLSKSFRVHYVRKFDPKARGKMGIYFREILIFPLVAARIAKILLKERPCLVVTTGGGATIQLVILAKMLGIHIVSLQSITRVTSLSATGKLIYPLCDDFLVQWEGLKKDYPRSKFWGRIL